jgi:dolichyl-phosphate-mannose--protein O-mannosyl transferase
MNKVYSPQFDLWLYPLFLLTIRRTAPIVIFALGSILAFYSELWWFSFQEGGPIALDRWALELATVVRAAGLVWAMGSAIFEPAPWWIAGDRPPNCSKATAINGASVSNLPMSKPSAPKEGMYDEWGRIISPRHRTSLKTLIFQIPPVKNRTPDEDPLALCVIATFTFFAIASYGLLSPSSLYFDETHYVPAARSLLELVAANQEHPLLAKEIMAASIRLLGDHPLGWRLPSLLAGALGLFAFGRLVWWTSHRRFATIAAIVLLGTNFLWFIHSRIAMLDIFAASLFLVALWQFAQTRSDGATHLRLRLAVTGTLLGLALGAKWNVAPLLPVPGVIFALFCLKEHQQAPSVTNFRDLVFARDRKWRLAEGLLFLGILPLCVYWLTFTPAFFYATPETAISPFDFIGQHIKMVASQASAVGSHPYQSIWTDWLLNRRPVWYLYENIDGAQRGVLLLGNPFTMLAGLPAVLWCCAAALQKRRADCALFAGLFLIAIGFWIVAAKPVQFYYHYLLPATFLAGCMALALDEIFSRSDWTRWIGATAVLFACVMFAWFYPIISSIPLAKGPGAFETWMWIDSWR